MEESVCGRINKNAWREYRSHILGKEPMALFKRIEENGIRRSLFRKKTRQCEQWENYGSLPENIRIYNQNKTDRCWIYAALTILETLIKEKGMDVGSLSANYVSFFDLFEKSNYFLQYVIENIDTNTDERTFSQKLLSPVRDAGQWHFFCNIARKYGLVPSGAMPDTKVSYDSRELVDVLSDILREDAAMLSAIHIEKKASIQEMIEEKQVMLEQIHIFLISCFGIPPCDFDLLQYTGSLSGVKNKRVTPEDFFEKYIGGDSIDRYITIVNFPQKSKPFYEKYSVEWMGNVWGANEGTYINVPVEKLKEYVKRQLNEGLPVWVGCDSLPYSDGDSGIYSTSNYDLKELGFRYALLDKSKNLDFGLSRPRHALVVRGYEPCRKLWLLQNSYGIEFGKGGYILASDEWFGLYIYEAVIDRSYLDDNALQCIERDVRILKPWDVLGTLA